MKLGFIGLGKMGSRMVEKLLENGFEVVVWNRSQEVAEQFSLKIKSQRSNIKSANQKLKIAASIEELVSNLESPRIIWIMLPAGEATQFAIDEVTKFVHPGDIVIDGGNSFYKDTQSRSEKFKAKSVNYLGIGVSGGVIAEIEGYPLMVGGDKSAYDQIQPILEALSKPKGGHAYLGTGGAGHFAKMVHNAIEYSYMQGIGEGFGILEKAPYKFDLTQVANIYTKNTLISGFMMDRTVDALQQDPDLSKIIGIIGKASKETIWAVKQAKEENIPIENIEQALEFRNRSQTDKAIQKSFAARLVSALREQFGGHKVMKKI